MPSAYQFRSAAQRLRTAADDADTLRRRMWSVGQDHGVTGGRLELLVDTALVADALTAASVQTECETLATLCDERAEICDQYVADLAAWERRTASWADRRDRWLVDLETNDHARPPGNPPTRPLAPFDWVEVG